MRITSGVLRGRTIYTDKGKSIRPATDRVRESLFSILLNYVDFEDISVVDLYAGTGSLGFECISRGTKNVIFVDVSRKAIQLMRRTAESLNCTDRCEILHTTAERFLREWSVPTSLIFADPPYAAKNVSELPLTVAGSKIAGNDTMLLIEHTKRIQFPGEKEYECFRQKLFGDTIVSFFRLNPTQDT